MTSIKSGDAIYVQILGAEWYGKLVDLDDNGIEFEIVSGSHKGGIVYSTERFIITKLRPKDEEGDKDKLDKLSL